MSSIARCPVCAVPIDARGAVMPSPSIIKGTLRNRRAANHPPVPKSLLELKIDGDWATTGETPPQPFLFFDSVHDAGSRILAFGSKQCMSVLIYVPAKHGSWTATSQWRLLSSCRLVN